MLKIAVVVLNLWVMLFVLLSIVSKLFVLLVDSLKVVCFVVDSLKVVLLVDGLKVVCLVCRWSQSCLFFCRWSQRARDGRRRLREAGPVSWLTRLLRRGGSWFDPASFKRSEEKYKKKTKQYHSPLQSI